MGGYMLKPVGCRVLFSDRFILRPFKVSDSEMMYHFYLKDPEVCKYLEFNPYKNSYEVYKSVLSYLPRYKDPFYFHWAIEDKLNGYVIGSVSIHNINHLNLSGELGICISKLYWNKGVGKEVLSLVMEHGRKDIGIKQFYAYYLEGNISSRRLLKSLGLKEDNKNNKKIVKNGQLLDIYCLKLGYFN